MGKNIGLTAAGRQYAAAHGAHYVAKDLGQALKHYKGIIAMHRGTQEARHSRAQILNIVNSLVPQQVLLDAHIELALTHIAHNGSAD